METLPTTAYTTLGQKSKLFETNSMAIGIKELLQRKIYVKKRHFFADWHFEKFINRMNIGYKMMEIKCMYKMKKFIVLKISSNHWSFSA